MKLKERRTLEKLDTEHQRREATSRQILIYQLRQGVKEKYKRHSIIASRGKKRSNQREKHEKAPGR